MATRLGFRQAIGVSVTDTPPIFPTLALLDAQSVVRGHCQAPGVVPTVLQTLEPLEYYRGGIAAVTTVDEDSAHYPTRDAPSTVASAARDIAPSRSNRGRSGVVKSTTEEGVPMAAAPPSRMSSRPSGKYATT